MYTFHIHIPKYPVISFSKLTFLAAMPLNVVFFILSCNEHFVDT